MLRLILRPGTAGIMRASAFVAVLIFTVAGCAAQPGTLQHRVGHNVGGPHQSRSGCGHKTAAVQPAMVFWFIEPAAGIWKRSSATSAG